MKIMFVLFFWMLPIRGNAELCSGLKDSTHIDSSVTGRLLGYLEDLKQRGVLKPEHILRLSDSLRTKNLASPFESSSGSVESLHGQELQTYLALPNLDRAKLQLWIKSYLQKNKKEIRRKQDSAGDTRNPNNQMLFNLLPPGDFQLTLNNPWRESKPKMSITQPVAVMSTLVTQDQWVREMGENPSINKDGHNTVTLKIGTNSVRMRPNHPVEHLTWWAAAYFANQMSIRYGLKPVYDLSGNNFLPSTRAADGSLNLETFHKGVVRIDSPNEDIYETEGFRLLTSIEYERLLQSPEIDPIEIRSHIWHGHNSQGTTQLVDSQPPVMIQNGTYFDLVGNVRIWTHTLVSVSPDPVNFNGKFNGFEVGIAGAHYLSEPGVWELEDHVQNIVLGAQLKTNGLRLARTLRPGEDPNSHKLPRGQR